MNYDTKKRALKQIQYSLNILDVDRLENSSVELILDLITFHSIDDDLFMSDKLVFKPFL